MEADCGSDDKYSDEASSLLIRFCRWSSWFREFRRAHEAVYRSKQGGQFWVTIARFSTQTCSDISEQRMRWLQE